MGMLRRTCTVGSACERAERAGCRFGPHAGTARLAASVEPLALAHLLGCARRRRGRLSHRGRGREHAAAGLGHARRRHRGGPRGQAPHQSCQPSQGTHRREKLFAHVARRPHAAPPGRRFERTALMWLALSSSRKWPGAFFVPTVHRAPSMAHVPGVCPAWRARPGVPAARGIALLCGPPCPAAATAGGVVGFLADAWPGARPCRPPPLIGVVIGAH